jgi:GNAT superfamily N-acetyltransferase
MDTLLATELWQRAGVYYVRTRAMVLGFNIPLNREIDAHDTPDTLYILAIDGVEPLGTCRLNLGDSVTAKIERVSVIEERRGHGVGRAVITAAEKELRSRGVKKIIISSRKEAAGFYEKLGYVSDWSTEEFNGVFTVVQTEKQLA